MIDDAEKLSIRWLHERGSSNEEIARAFKCSARTVYNILHQDEEDMAPMPVLSQKDKELIRQLHERGMSQVQIADLLGTNNKNISRYLLSIGIRSPHARQPAASYSASQRDPFERAATKAATEKTVSKQKNDEATETDDQTAIMRAVASTLSRMASTLVAIECSLGELNKRSADQNETAAKTNAQLRELLRAWSGDGERDKKDPIAMIHQTNGHPKL